MKRTVDSKFWTSQKVKKLSLQTKFLFQYFMTCPATHLSGIYYVPMPTIIYETGMSEPQIRKSIEILSNGHMVRFDYYNNVVFVVNMLKHQGWSKKIKTAVVKQLNSLQNSPLINEFLSYYDQLRIPYPALADRVSVLPVSVSVPDTVSDKDRVSDKSTTTVPADDIIKSYHELLPELPSIREPGAVADSIKTRWREKKERQCLEWWRSLFERIKRADKLMGRVQGFNWRCPGLRWIVNPTNLCKILNGEYDNTAAAVQQGERGWQDYKPEKPGVRTPGVADAALKAALAKIKGSAETE